MARSKWSKFLDQYLPIIVGLAILIPIGAARMIYLYYQDIEWPRQDYQKREIHHRIESLYFEKSHGYKIPFARFDMNNMEAIELYNVNYEDLQVGDSVVKRKNDMHLVIYRADTLFYDSKNYKSR